MTTRKTLKDFINNPQYSTHHDEQNVPDTILRYNIKDNNNDELFSQYSGDDLQEDIKETLGRYIKYIIDNAQNIYGPSYANYEEIDSYKRGDPELTTNNQNYNVFVTDDDPNLEKSTSQYLPKESVDLFLDKTGGNPNKSGHTVLSNANNDATGIDNTGHPTPNKEKDLSTDIIKSHQAMMKANNRFSNTSGGINFSGDPEITVEEYEGDKDNLAGSLLLENVFGEHTKENMLKLDELKNLGESLLYRSSGFANLDNVEDPQDIANSMNRTMTNAGIKYESDINNYEKLSSNAYNAKYSSLAFLKKISNELSPDGENLRGKKGEIFEQNTSTYGQTYNSNYHFFGKNTKIQKIQLLLAIKTIYKIYEDTYKEILRSLLDNINNNNSYEDSKVSEGSPYKLGTADKRLSIDLIMLAETAFVRTIRPYNQCIERGMMVCFGYENSNIKTRSEESIKSSTSGISNVKGSTFWHSVLSTVISKATDDFAIMTDLSNELGTINSGNIEYWEYKINNLQNDPVLKFFNTMATIGDISFQAFQGQSLDKKSSQIRHPRDIDALPDEPGNRVGKSRKKHGLRKNQLAWGQNEVPSMYMLPMNVIYAAAKLDRGPESVNPLRGIIGSELVENMYMSTKLEGSGNRIPPEAVKAIEDRLDAEYVPLYIQDLRTNEIISFNAFITSLTDNFNTSYAGSGGYGRLDQVKTFENTTRSVNVDFHLVSTSKEDFNTMWYKINKLITLIYPQWTQGTRVADDYGNIFIQPHSQVIGATPVVRLRVGDVIKSNYSKFNLARVFGIGDTGVTAVLYDNIPETKGGPSPLVQDVPIEQYKRRTPDQITARKEYAKIKDAEIKKIMKNLILAYGSPLQFQDEIGEFLSGKIPGDFGKLVGNNTGEILTEYLKNGFVSPIASLTTYYQIQDPAVSEIPSDFLSQTGDITNIVSSAIQKARLGYVPFSTTLLLKGNMSKGYMRKDGSGRIYTQRPIKVMITSFGTPSDNIEDTNYSNQKINTQGKQRTSYSAKIVDGTLLGDLTKDFGKEIVVYHEDLIPLPSAVFFNTLANIASVISTFPTSLARTVTSGLQDSANNLGLGSSARNIVDTMAASGETRFMDSSNNPFVKAYESTRGRGLAGVLNGMNFTWYENEGLWETDFNSRAPKSCKVSFKLDVIHDIPPGLDHAGYNRAPLYNVGDIMREISGDVYDDGGNAAEFRYKKGTTAIVDYNPDGET